MNKSEDYNDICRFNCVSIRRSIVYLASTETRYLWLIGDFININNFSKRFQTHCKGDKVATLKHHFVDTPRFVDYEKAFDRVDWRKMMWMLKDIGVDWRDRNLISKLYLICYVDCDSIITCA